MPEPTTEPSSAPSASPGPSLTSRRLEVDGDVVAFTKLATDAGWGDGLPLVPPTPDLVGGHVAASGCPADQLLAELPPRQGACTVEKLAVNAVMAGAPAAAMPLMCAAVDAMADPEFDLFALNTTTSCVVPALFVNGPARHELDIPYAAGCFGGQAGPAPAIGRALRLVMRNVGGQVVGVSSKSVFGQPGRVVGMVVAEWEERSPWAPFAERRGVPGNAVTVYGAVGTMDVADIVADTGAVLAELVGRSIAYMGTNAFLSPYGAEVLVCLAPPWADLIAADHPTIEEVQERLWHHAALPLDWFPAPHRARLERDQRVHDDGRVHLVPAPDDVLVLVCGGLGNLHALALHNFGPTYAVTRPF